MKLREADGERERWAVREQAGCGLETALHISRGDRGVELLTREWYSRVSSSSNIIH